MVVEPAVMLQEFEMVVEPAVMLQEFEMVVEPTVMLQEFEMVVEPTVMSQEFEMVVEPAVMLQEFEMDPGIKRDLEQQKLMKIEQVKKEMQFEEAKRTLALSKLQTRFITHSSFPGPKGGGGNPCITHQSPSKIALLLVFLE